ncbi:DUF4383 domain-containing protein [Nocardia seriolae]|uniref:DUF4383 domain-containing protein n=1 Tax=Nocardia seriolae TaxID=37332 RepID=A0ABC9Z175_9NOCA|nr:DUF4383 domain-containing protein [Nocardia seriolae]APA98468.1 hypothetical protein NS506_04420 [Nocardia seriolae]OJF80345.1 hypothetical protein NS14008_15460 [Nocardia seriolae]QOW35705.1 DUF4383 domain-containing protein [Nocardia seriolae]QUN16804.1 DUF4383 domain-containing protein [Nocardia seriolae]WKY55432.1 DUF4383 domain-containing protein [Nocardia seriolae]
MLFDTLRAYTLRYVTAIFETPLQLFVFLAGAWFTANGVIAFGIYPDMAFGGAMHSCTIRFLGFIPVTVNGWHALFHLISGLAGLVMATRRPRAELYTLIFAPYYLLVAALGFAGGDHVLHLIAVDTFGNVVHTIEGSALMVVGVLAALRPRERQLGAA